VCIGTKEPLFLSREGDQRMRIVKLILVVGLVPCLLGAQQDVVDRLRAVLPPDVADKVVAIVADATSHDLPGAVIADRALEATAKGRNAADAAAAAQATANDLAAARDAIRSTGRAPQSSEIEAAATAQELGVNGATISALASSVPSSRSLAVPLSVIGALVNRGLSADAALQVVLDRIKTQASDADLARMPGEAGRLIAAGYKPSDVGRALSGVSRPVGLPTNGGRPGEQPNRPSHPTGP
jgi:hypothetical protein